MPAASISKPRSVSSLLPALYFEPRLGPTTGVEAASAFRDDALEAVRLTRLQELRRTTSNASAEANKISAGDPGTQLGYVKVIIPPSRRSCEEAENHQKGANQEDKDPCAANYFVPSQYPPCNSRYLARHQYAKRTTHQSQPTKYRYDHRPISNPDIVRKNHSQPRHESQKAGQEYERATSYKFIRERLKAARINHQSEAHHAEHGTDKSSEKDRSLHFATSSCKLCCLS
jgi:hypothetical protein